MKSFRGDLIKLYNLLRQKIPFAFTRFSDGCEAIINNYKLEIDNDKVVFGDTVFNKGFASEDHKLFDPSIPKHQEVRKKLFESFLFEKHNYFKGLICPCCCGEERFQKMKDLYGEDKKHMTFSNLFVNLNYDFFLDVVTPEIAKRDIILICNEKSNIEKLPFKVKKDFRVGNNCIINNFNIIKEIKEYYYKNKLQDTILLSSASSLSNMIIYELFKNYDNNTYLNIGSCYNNYLGLSIERDYLLARWKYKKQYGLSHRNCIIW